MKRTKSELILQKRQKSAIDSLSDETVELWKQAYESKLWLTGDPVKVDGQEVDFSMFDFVMSVTKFNASDLASYLKMFHKFWLTLWPYIDNVVTNLQRYESQLKTLIGDENVTLYNYANQNLELKCYQKFMVEELPKYTGVYGYDAREIQAKFEEYHNKYKEESAAAIAVLKAQEEERVKAEQEKQKKKDEEAKRKAFERSLR